MAEYARNEDLIIETVIARENWALLRAAKPPDEKTVISLQDKTNHHVSWQNDGALSEFSRMCEPWSRIWYILLGKTSKI